MKISSRGDLTVFLVTHKSKCQRNLALVSCHVSFVHILPKEGRFSGNRFWETHQTMLPRICKMCGDIRSDESHQWDTDPK